MKQKMLKQKEKLEMKICFSDIAAQVKNHQGPTLAHRPWFGLIGNSKHSLLHCPVVRKCENVPISSKPNIGMSSISFTLMHPSTCAKLEKSTSGYHINLYANVESLCAYQVFPVKFS